MSGNQVNFGSGGTYNERLQVQGDLIQGDKNEGCQFYGDFNRNQNLEDRDFDETISEIQELLTQLQERYPSSEAQMRAATDLAVQAQSEPSKKNSLIRLGEYIASNGGIEAGIGKVIELALTLIGI